MTYLGSLRWEAECLIKVIVKPYKKYASFLWRSVVSDRIKVLCLIRDVFSSQSLSLPISLSNLLHGSRNSHWSLTRWHTWYLAHGRRAIFLSSYLYPFPTELRQNLHWLQWRQEGASDMQYSVDALKTKAFGGESKTIVLICNTKCPRLEPSAEFPSGVNIQWLPPIVHHLSYFPLNTRIQMVLKCSRLLKLQFCDFRGNWIMAVSTITTKKWWFPQFCAESPGKK